MRFCVVNLGCKVNRVESDSFARQLHEAGAYESCEEAADLIVVNTCTVTGEAEKKARKATRHALRSNNNAEIVVTGCAAAISAEEFSSMDGRVSVVPKYNMSHYLKTWVSGHALASPEEKAPASDKQASDGADETLPYHMRPRTRVGVKIQDGCDNACTYCIVHVARGAAQSRDVDEVINECVAHAQAGVREIVLSGINVGSYSSGGTNLSSLLIRLLRQTEDIHASEEYATRFRLSSIEPMDVDEDLIEILSASDGRICRHLHLPLQSGSSRILHAMARPYEADGFDALVARLRKAVPNLALTTDVIVGFPGEDEDDFTRTCELVRRCGFAKLHVFPYSPRKGTPAAAQNNQVPKQIRNKRAAQLRTLSDTLRTAERTSRKNTRELALVLDKDRALSESYYEIAPPSGSLQGLLVACTL